MGKAERYGRPGSRSAVGRIRLAGAGTVLVDEFEDPVGVLSNGADVCGTSTSVERSPASVQTASPNPGSASSG